MLHHQYLVLQYGLVLHFLGSPGYLPFGMEGYSSRSNSFSPRNDKPGIQYQRQESRDIWVVRFI